MPSFTHNRFRNVHKKMFLSLIDKDISIQKFLMYDRCYLLADRYLLAMVFAYFIRSGLPFAQYNRVNFFAALCMANEMEEDLVYKNLLAVWAFGRNTDRKEAKRMLNKARFDLWQAMDFRARVTKKCCLKVMASMKDSPLWARHRSTVHGGARRRYVPKEWCTQCSLPDSGIFQPEDGIEE